MNSNWHSEDHIKRWLTNEYFKAIAILIIVLTLFYRDVVFNGRTFLMETAVQGTMPNDGPYNDKDTTTGFVVNDAGALAWFAEPLNKFVSESIKQGDFPLWNPYAGLAGNPLLADGQTGPLEPIQFVFFFFPNRFWPYSIDLQLLIRYFLSGFGCYLFAKRLKLNFWASMATGVIFMLSSYFVTYGDHPQIKIESLLPLVLYGYDRLADLEDMRGFWICSLFIGWAIIAAMPEATFFGLLLGSLWFFYKALLKIVEEKAVSSQLIAPLKRYLSSTLFGFLISAAYLLPFIEYVLVSKSVHTPGLVNNPLVLSNDPLPLSLLSGLIFQAQGFYFIQFGFVVIFLSVYLLVGLPWVSKHRSSIIFFSSYAIIFLLSIFNFPLTNWIRGLPVLNQIVIHKYSIPSIVFSLAILAGILIDGVNDISLSYKRISLALAIVLAIFIGLPILGSTSASLSNYFGDNKLVYAAFGLIIGVLSIPVYILAFLYKHQKISARGLQFGLLILVAFEPFLWESRINRRDRVDPYQTPPFVEYLRRNKEPFRIFGLDGILYPNISSAYRLSDIRWLDALSPKRVFDFSSQFLSSDEAEIIRFTGTQYPISDKMFDLLNVKYVLAQNPSEKIPDECNLAAGVQQNANQPDFGVNTPENIIFQQYKNRTDLREYLVNINGSVRQAILNQPHEKFSLKLTVPQQSTELDFSIGPYPQVLRSEWGNSVGFQVSISEGESKTMVFSKNNDPKNNPCDRKWSDESISLEKWAGKDVILEFSTDDGPAGNIYGDWAFWGNVRLVSQSDQPVNSRSNYELVHKDQDVIIYKNKNVLPRAFVVYKVINVTTSDIAMNSLANPTLDPAQTAVVENLPNELVKTIDQNGQQSQSVSERAKHMNSGELDVQVHTKAPGLLVVSEQYYPGWKAYVDGREVSIYAVDGILRGIYLVPGSHRVQFKYRPPSFMIGGIISIVSLLISIVFVFFRSWLSQKHHG